MAGSTTFKLFMVLLLALFLAVSVAAAGDVALESTEPLQGEIPAAAATGILKSSRKLIGSSPPTCNGQCGGCVPCNRHLVSGDGGRTKLQASSNADSIEFD
ncbi:hypothetical protein QJS10_CPA06g00581 [Acorus calamus]|uniref:Epidermal patterning factor-like protein n=1 Tax=Acorus calamus TaxID=4465 RepID=A0AAV9EKT0_ACOCL|nr:hypothetical protein QJS10_CPA06g00581 [Acorus calamus]